jgi:hypothetical protein
VQIIGGKNVKTVIVKKQSEKMIRFIRIIPLQILISTFFFNKNQFIQIEKSNNKLNEMLNEVIKSFIDLKNPNPKSNL